MLMNLLPGLRELRAPLVSGYLWLISVWLLLGRMNWLPSERPPGDGEVARLWDLGGTLGKTVVLAAVTFAAYLIGSFLEMDPDGQLAARLKPLVLADRIPRYMLARRKANTSHVYSRAMSHLGITSWNSRQGTAVAHSISLQARTDLFDLLYQHKALPETDPDELIDAAIPAYRPGLMMMKRSEQSDEAKAKRLANDIAADSIIYSIVQEMQQLASRLLVKNKDLYGKYDRLMAEASVRMNVSIPLTIMLGLAIWLSGLSVLLRLGLTVVALGFGYMLMRQGFLRAISARDVIVQALVIGEVESRYLPAEEKSTGGPAEETPERTEPSGADPGLRRSLVMSGSSEGDPEGGEGAGGVAGVLA